MKRKLILDFDSTIVDSIKAYCTSYSQIYKNYKDFKEPNPDLVTTWDLSCQCPLEINAENIFGSKRFFDNLELFPQAYEELLKLNEEYELIICSIGNYDNISNKSIYIKEKLPFIKESILLVNAGIRMSKAAVQMQGCLFMDDHKANLDSSNADIKICYGKTYSWNENHKGYWIHSWKDAYNKVKTIEYAHKQYKDKLTN